MTSRHRKFFSAVAIFTVFAVSQVYVQANLIATSATTAATQAITARLTTRGNQAIMVNGASTNSGSTILTGATIETPDGVGATVDLGPLGRLDLAPNTAVQLDFSDGKVTVKLIRGCAILRTKKNTEGEFTTDQGSVGKTEKEKAGVLDYCLPPGGGAPMAGQAANAGVGAAGAVIAAGGGAAAGGISTTAIVLGAAGFGGLLAAAFIPCERGRNPSPASASTTNDNCGRSF